MGGIRPLARLGSAATAQLLAAAAAAVTHTVSTLVNVLLLPAFGV